MFEQWLVSQNEISNRTFEEFGLWDKIEPVQWEDKFMAQRLEAAGMPLVVDEEWISTQMPWATEERVQGWLYLCSKFQTDILDLPAGQTDTMGRVEAVS